MIPSAAGLLVAGFTLRGALPRAWALLAVAALGIGGAAVVSCQEDNTVHTAFAFLFFVSVGAFEAVISQKAFAHEREQQGQSQSAQTQTKPPVAPLFKAGVSSAQPRLVAAASAYVLLCLIATGLFHTGVGVPRSPVVVSVCEWTCTATMLGFFFYFSSVVSVDADDS
jgi:hypothetical protein